MPKGDGNVTVYYCWRDGAASRTGGNCEFCGSMLVEKALQVEGALTLLGTTEEKRESRTKAEAFSARVRERQAS